MQTGATSFGPAQGWHAYADRVTAARDVLAWMQSRLGWEIAALAEPRGEGWHIVASVPAGLDHASFEVGSAAAPQAFAASRLVAADGSVVAMVLAFGGPQPPVDGDVEMTARLLASIMATPRSSRRSGSRRTPGVVGRSRFVELVAAEERRGGEEGCDVTVLIIDLPRSRARGSGQQVSAVAHELATAARGTDVVGRLGPARLGILAPELTSAAAPAVADRLRERLGLLGHGARVTWCSLGDEGALLRPLETMLSQGRRRDGHFLICGECGRRGAYVATEHGVLRCKYCRASVGLEPVPA